MRFGTKVLVTRGSERIPAGIAGCLRQVKGVLIGALGQERFVRLSEDDLLDTTGWASAGTIGHWGRSAVKREKV